MRVLTYALILGTTALFAVNAPVFAQMHLDPSITPPSADGSHNCSPHTWHLEHALSHGKVGAASLCFYVEADGTISNMTIMESSGHEELDRGAMNCVSSWRYKPATKDGQPIKVPWAVIVGFWIGHGPDHEIPDLTEDCQRALASGAAPSQ